MRTYFFIFALFSFLQACTQPQTPKLKGVSLVGSRELPTDTTWQNLKALGCNAITLMPYAYMKEGSTDLTSHTKWQWNGESLNGISQCIKDAKKHNITPIIKPHLWIMDGGFTGHLSFDTPENRHIWNQKYIEYIVSFAKLAAQHQLEYFILANEMQSTWEASPEDFKALIDVCRSVFHGKLIYASNWDEYHKFPFWNLLDGIGINAYFPLKNASEAPKIWEERNQEIANFAKQKQLPVYFTELGYRSMDNPLEAPWVSDTEANINEAAQAQAWELFFEHVWTQEYVKGVFVWKWFPNLKNDWKGTGFTPQNKQAQQVIQKAFLRE